MHLSKNATNVYDTSKYSSIFELLKVVSKHHIKAEASFVTLFPIFKRTKTAGWIPVTSSQPVTIESSELLVLFFQIFKLSFYGPLFTMDSRLCVSIEPAETLDEGDARHMMQEDILMCT